MKEMGIPVSSDLNLQSDIEEFCPEGPVTDLYWWLIRNKGVAASDDDITEWAIKVRDEIIRDTGYALHAITFKDQKKLLEWMVSDMDIYRWALAHETYRRMLTDQQLDA